MPSATSESRIRKAEALLLSRRWRRADSAISSLLKADAKDHWLWARLAAARYQQYDYRGALKCAKKALSIEPNCSLAIWEWAEALYMLQRYEEAIKIYQKLTRLGVEGVRQWLCNEGLLSSRALVSDAYYRAGRAYYHLGKYAYAARYIKKGLALRGPKVRALYPISDLRNLLEFAEDRRKQRSTALHRS